MRRSVLIASAALGVLATSCTAPEPIREQYLIHAIRRAVLESVEAEKISVLATTDEESEAAAAETRKFAGEVDRLLGELRPPIARDGRESARQALGAFEAAWTELKDVDERLLALAVRNTNLKAARLSVGEGAAALERFVAALAAIRGESANPDDIRALADASSAALRVHILILVHIPESDPAEMTRLDEQIQALSEEVDRHLARARESGSGVDQQLAEASRAWAEHRRVAADVVRLSWENSNVISFDVSVHEKRKATRDCLDSLDALSNAVGASMRATR
jgi:hypothetical protein